MADNGRHARGSRSGGSGRGSARARRSAPASGRYAEFATQADSNRIIIPLLFFALLAIGLFIRLFYVQVIMAPDYRQQAEDIRTIEYDITARRGTIYDRNGTVLATSVDATSVYTIPEYVEDANYAASKLAEILGGKSEDYLPTLVSNTTFAYVKRQVDVSVAQKLKDLGIKGIYFEPTSRREYPNGQVAGQIVGLCDIDGNGISGLESYYDDLLSGQNGHYKAEVGVDGTPIVNGVEENTASVDGQDIIISVDLELQKEVEDRLLQDKEGLMANGGSAVIMDGASGEILAAASLPLLDPSSREDIAAKATELQVVSSLFEPGSIFKSVSAMAILESGAMTPDTELFCPSSITADGYTISDAHERGDATYTLRQILDQSSNVGISLAAENLGFDKLYDAIIRYNLHSKTGVDYPGEGDVSTNILGYMTDFSQLSRVGAYNVSFGQGISVTPLQMVRFYGALTNQGVEVTPHFLISKPQTGEVASYETEEVIKSKEAIENMTSMLKTVVTDGTGTDAAIDGFNVAGKTSTAEIYDEENGGYRNGVYNMAFTGFLADSTSQLVCFVGANETDYGCIVTPVFKDIMISAINRFKISPE